MSTFRRSAGILSIFFMISASADTTQLSAPVGGGGGTVSAGAIEAQISVGDTMEGGIATAGAIQVKGGYTGQLYDPVALEIGASPTTVAEGSSRQLVASAVMDDDTTLALATTEVAWSVDSGPLTGIDANGLATAANVYQDTVADARGSWKGLAGILTLTVLESLPDNFSFYAADGIPDIWQVTHFGPSPDASTPGSPNDNPDSDAYNNFLEFASGSNPNDRSGRLVADIPGGTFTPGAPMIAVQFSPLRLRFVRRVDHASIGLTYTPQFTNTLDVYEPSVTVPSVLVPDPGTGYELVEVPFPLFLSSGLPAQFTRLKIQSN